MKNRKPIKLAVGLLCILILLIAVAVAITLDSRSPDPIFGIFQTEPPTLPQESIVPTEGIVNPTESTVQSTEGTVNPTEGTVNPTEGTVNPTESTVQPTEGTVNPTESTVQPTEGTVNPTEGTVQPTEGTVQPTEGTVQPTEGTVNPTEGTVNPTESTVQPTEGTVNPTMPSDEAITPPEEIPPSVTVPPEKDPDTGEIVGVTFPCKIQEYDLVIEKVAPYSGMFVEDGSNANTQNVAMLLVNNNGDSSVEYTQICLLYGEEKLLFDISALPAGEKLVVQEKSGKAIPEGDVSYVSATVVRRAEMEMSKSEVRVTDNGDNTLTITNLTGETIPTVRVFYKYYMENEEIFVGGIAFTVRITRLGAGASVTIQPSHYASQTCRVVMVLTYDSEV